MASVDVPVALLGYGTVGAAWARLGADFVGFVCALVLSRFAFKVPLPLGRLCTIVGARVPGPRVVKGEARLQIAAYEYPFGRRLMPLIARAIPNSWMQRKAT